MNGIKVVLYLFLGTFIYESFLLIFIEREDICIRSSQRK